MTILLNFFLCRIPFLYSYYEFLLVVTKDIFYEYSLLLHTVPLYDRESLFHQHMPFFIYSSVDLSILA